MCGPETPNIPLQELDTNKKNFILYYRFPPTITKNV